MDAVSPADTHPTRVFAVINPIHRHSARARAELEGRAAASGLDLTVLVTGRTLITSLVGAILGCLTGWLVNAAGGQPTPLAFAAAVGILATLAAIVSAIPPAIYATKLDPVDVLRTP